MKPELLDNNFYTIKGTTQDTTNIRFVNFQYGVSPNIYQKAVKVQSLTFLNKDITIKDIKNEIDKDFFKIITGLSNQHSEIASSILPNISKKFDINIKDLKSKGLSVDRTIIAKFNNVSNLIAVEGRIGPSQYIVSNNDTYNYILNYIGHNQFLFHNGIMMIGNMPYIINDNIEGDIILLGRKNRIDQPGVHCLILTNDKGDILFDTTYDPKMINKKVTIYYKIVDLGTHPYYQFYSIKTRNIAYYRKLKLKRIKDLYGNCYKLNNEN